MLTLLAAGCSVSGLSSPHAPDLVHSLRLSSQIRKHASAPHPAGISVIWHVVGTFSFMIALLVVAPSHQSAKCE